MEKRFLYALAFFIAWVVFKKFPVFVCYNQFIVYHFHLIFFQAFSVTVLQNFKVAFYSNNLIECRNQKVPGTNGWVANFEIVNYFVCFVPVVNFVVKFFKRCTIPAFCFIKLLYHRFANGFAAHIHGYKPGGKKRAIFITVYFLENQAKNRSIDKGFIVFLYFFASFACEIIRVKKFKQIFKRIDIACSFFASAVF